MHMCVRGVEESQKMEADICRRRLAWRMYMPRIPRCIAKDELDELTGQPFFQSLPKRR